MHAIDNASMIAAMPSRYPYVMQIQAGVSPIKPINLRDVFAGKKGVLVNVPGAFTPGCSKVRISLSERCDYSVSTACHLSISA